MAETSDYDPGPWKGYDFSAARSAYDAHAGRSYDDAVATGVDAKNLVPSRITTDSPSPLVIACDVTSSMSDWPKVIFSKLPYLDIEGKSYLGDQMKISFAAVGDAYSDKYPLQVREFCAGVQMEEELKKLIIEGGGGGQTCESYDVAALYYARNCDMPNATRPIFIFIGDEGLYESVDNKQADKHAKVKVEERLTTHYLIGELKRKFSVYCIRKLYNTNSGDGMTDLDQRIQKQWTGLLGEDHVVILPSADRVVDVIFGLLAAETGKGKYFEDELNGRQKPEQVKTVMKSLNSIHLAGPPSLKKLPSPKSGKSVTRRSGKDTGENSVSLL